MNTLRGPVAKRVSERARLPWRSGSPWVLGLEADFQGSTQRETVTAGLYMLVAGALLGILSWATWAVLDDVLGRALVAQAVAVTVAIGVGLGAYAALVWSMGLDEARQIQRLFADRLSRRGTA